MSHECTVKCESRPDCEVCGRRKQPAGRSMPSASYGGYCSPAECPGYYQGELAGHLFRGELAEMNEHEGDEP